MDADIYFVKIMWVVLCFLVYCISYKFELKIMIITEVKSAARLRILM